ncbi:hypothetical protein NYZ99_07270 [Maribacter litopenaei]|uniref:Glucagon / GIP / secretin / VIP family domain-containing protein n=1 Tax=Maribacter litopenaei TaxID=2976127 RepID=A0ABY5YAM6_9FLAO|nr:hypothetical protein [Maribacter litopenaei]UWX56096.1 hypothetical protein NYZ99_07270 [Maribacter litopenaei]
MQNTILGYGSFFQKSQVNEAPHADGSFMEDYQLFYAGRYALKYIFLHICENYNVPTISATHLLLPSYKKMVGK